MPLHPEAEALLQAMADSQYPPLETMTPEEARALRREQRLLHAPPPDPHVRLEDRAIPGPGGDIPLRVYTPPGDPPYAGLIYYHGGGWVLGDLDAYDHVCSPLARATGAKVISVDYRLAPEHPFPAGLDDTYASIQWLLTHAWDDFDIDPRRMAAAGDSAGANLLTNACYLIHQRGVYILQRQVLIYPVAGPPGTTPSQAALAQGYFLTERGMHWFYEHYTTAVSDAERNPLIFPLLHHDLRGLPPTLVVTAEYDPLRDEGEAYARRLQDAGVRATITRYPGMIHGFLSLLPLLSPRNDLIDEIAGYLHPVFTERR